ncbi:N-acetylmuramoyl-L-alanine amidase [bacterium]|nr:N-acetylmuramoyl-L-alanine amidase [bacterium]
MRRSRKLYAVIFALAALGLGLAGCAALKKGDPAGYGPRALSYAGYDFSVLEGQRIVLDPGHGGRYSGAIGPGGLTEKEVNLAVALILRDLLAGYGARVSLTRSVDADLLPAGASGPLHADLAARVDSADSDSGMIFLSIHHNSPGAPGSHYNATETYYKRGDTGPSLDLARFIHARLSADLGLSRKYLRPGNYYVLRHNDRTAVLGEASYLSHPGTESKLRGAAARQLEAYSYLLGLVDYLSRGVPLVEDLTVGPGAPAQELQARLSAGVRDELRGGGIDPQAIEVTVDGAPVPFSYDQSRGRLDATLEGLPNGNHLAAVRVRNLRGNAAREALAQFQVAVPPAHVELSSSLGRVPLDGVTPVKFTARVSDRRGLPVADSTWVLFEFSDPNLPPRTVLTSGGRAFCEVIPAANHNLSVTASCGDVSGTAGVEIGPVQATVLVLQVEDSRGGLIRGTARVSFPGGGVFNCDAEGWLSLAGLSGGPCPLVVECPGYVPQALNLELSAGRGFLERVRLVPALGGTLLGKRIALDPAAGGESAGETGALGTRESDVNWRVCAYLRDYLERAGATVLVTRQFEEGAGAWERVNRSEDFDPAVLVSVTHSGAVSKKAPRAATVVYHYPASEEGRRLAVLAAVNLKGFAGCPWRGAAGGTQRLIQQVSCPAVLVCAASLADTVAENLLSSPAACRAEAQAVFEALAVWSGWTPGGDNPHLSGRVSDGHGHVVPEALVWLDSWLPTQTDSQGRFLFQNAGPGGHSLTVEAGGRCYGPQTATTGHRAEILLGGD